MNMNEYNNDRLLGWGFAFAFSIACWAVFIFAIKAVFF